MTYTIINPSDAYTLKSDVPVAAVLACLFLGEGHYGLHDEQGETVCPLFIFGDPEPWLKEHFGIGIGDGLKAHYREIVAALRTVLIGDRHSRPDVEAAIARMDPAEAEAYLAKRHDRLRSSLNDIGTRAARLADCIESERSS